MTAGASAAIASAEQLFREHWPAPPRCTWAAGCPCPGPGSPTRRWPRPTSGSWTRPRRSGRTGTAQIEAARRAFYQGFVAEAIDGYLAGAEVMDVTGQPHRALLSGAGPGRLAGPAWSSRPPWTSLGLTVCKTGPWGQGPVFLQQLALLDGLGLASLAPGSAELPHAVIECAKLAFADREAWYGDPRFADVPLAALLSAGYAAQRRRWSAATASAELRPGCPAASQPRLPGYATGAVRLPSGTATPPPSRPRRSPGRARAPRWEVTGPGAPCRRPAGHRRHLPPRCGGPVRQPGVGHAERRLAAELAGHPRPRLLPGHPGADVHADRRACPTPWHRASGRGPRCRPSLALRGGEPYLAFGTPGGDQQDQWTLAFFLNHVLFGMNLQEAIDAPRSTPGTSRRRSTRAGPRRGRWTWRAGSARP